MPDILIDRSGGAGGKKHTLHRCHYCNHDKYPFGKVIMPHDKHARKTDKNDWMCGECTLELSQKVLDAMNRRKGLFVVKR